MHKNVCFQSVLCNPLSSPAVVHVSAHLVNVVNFSVSYSDDFPALNLARYRGEVRHAHSWTLYLWGPSLTCPLTLTITGTSLKAEAGLKHVIWPHLKAIVSTHVLKDRTSRRGEKSSEPWWAVWLWTGISKAFIVSHSWPFSSTWNQCLPGIPTLSLIHLVFIQWTYLSFNLDIWKLGEVWRESGDTSSIFLYDSGSDSVRWAHEH